MKYWLIFSNMNIQREISHTFEILYIQYEENGGAHEKTT
jgi:hypothetical protein